MRGVADAELRNRLETLETQIARSTDRLRSVMEVCRRIAATARLDDLLPLIAREAARLVELDSALVRLVEGDTLVKVAVAGAAENITFAERLKFGESTSGRAALERRTVESWDLARDPHYRVDHREYALAHGLASTISVPMIVRDELVGTLAVFGRRAERLRPDELELLEAFADQAAIAIERARLLDQLEQRNQELERISRLKSQFLANMSHELRTPMNSIIGYSQLILDGLDGPLNEAQARDLEKVVRSAEDLLRLINDILDLSKIEAGRLDLKLESLDVAEVLRSAVETVSPLARAKRLELCLEVADDLPQVRADGTRLRQIVLNLLSNAVKFTEIGGITVRAWPEDGQMVISVADTGIGIPPEAQEYIFDEFRQVDGSTTRKYGGTGLGLAIARKLVMLQGGNLWLRSEPGRGSEFFVSLPFVAATPTLTSADGDEPAAYTPSPGETIILAIDDDPDVLELISRQLGSEGYRVIGLLDGRQAVARARELRPAAITLDISMPEYDGWQVLHDLRSDPVTAEIPILILSMIENRELGFSLGAADYLLKPIRKEALVAALQRLGATPDRSLVLMVDDDPDTLRLLESGIAAAGYRVATAQSGDEALRLATAEPPGCVVLDLLMPGIDGFEVLAQLRTMPATRSVPVIIVTAKDLTPADRERLNGSVQHILLKACYPRDKLLRELSSVIRRACGVRSASAVSHQPVPSES